MSLSNRLKQKLSEKSMPQSSLAKEAGMSNAAIYKLVSGKSLHSPNLDKIAKVLEVSPQWLMFGNSESDIEDIQKQVIETPNAEQTLDIIETIESSFGVKNFLKLKNPQKISLIKIITTSLNSDTIDSDTLKLLIDSVL